jgi:P27 family predicted phage terminase small subunit
MGVFMPGPPPTPTHLKLIRGNPGKRPVRPEPQPVIAESPPDAPSYLVGYACDEWYRLAPELHRLGLLTLLDVTALAAYCWAYMHWPTAEEALARMAERDQTTSGLLVKRADGNAGQNPLLSISRKAAADMVRYASEFGLSPAARARISAGVGYEPAGPGKFDGLLA